MAETIDYARKYRPGRLSDYVGNQAIINTAKSFLKYRNGDEQKLPQVVLLQGHAGCGKTTLARLLCSCYCCMEMTEDGDACGECDSCKEFAHYIETGDNSNLLDITEVDSAILNGKEDIEQLIDEMHQPSMSGGWRCYIFDECHRLSQQAQSSLLKTIEEPPERVLICLCTTDANKILNTIRSRVSYDFRVQKPKRAELVTLLARICKQEGIKYDNRALSVIALQGDCVPRNTLKLLSRVVTECGEVTYDKTAATLNVIGEKYYFAFYEFMAKEVISTYQYLAYLTELKSQMELEEFVAGLTTFTLRGIYIYNSIKVDEVDESEYKLYAQLFSKFTADELAYMLDWLARTRNAPNLELQLMLLGYTGINKAIQRTSGAASSDDTTENKLDSQLAALSEAKATAASDAAANTEAVTGGAETLTQEEAIAQLVQSQMTPMSEKEMLDLFDGAVMTVDP